MKEHSNINVKKGSTPYKIRLIVQSLIFITFICLLLYADPLAEKDKTVEIFLCLSPLSAIGTMVAAREFIINYRNEIRMNNNGIRVSHDAERIKPANHLIAYK